MEFSLSLDPLTEKYLLDLAESQGAFADGREPYIFEVPHIRDFFAGMKGVTVKEIESPDIASLRISLGFEDLFGFFASSLPEVPEGGEAVRQKFGGNNPRRASLKMAF